MCKKVLICCVTLIVIMCQSVISNETTSPITLNTENDIERSRTSPTESNIPMINTMPTSCKGFKPLSNQPKQTPNTSWKKCCPHGKKLEYDKRTCIDTNEKFQPPIIKAKFYEDCIEDLEEEINLKVVINEECNVMYRPSKYNEKLYIIQNGSLLVIDSEYDVYEVKDNYCIDYEHNETIAFVCEFLSDPTLSKFQSQITAICMLLSVPCLILTAVLHSIIPKLRNLHGVTLASHSMCLAMGYLLLGLLQVNVIQGDTVGYLIQYFILACFFWMLAMTVDITINVWFFLPKNKVLEKFYKRYIVYSCIAMGLPMLFVIIAKIKNLSIPPYYVKGLTDASQLSQKYFIIPIAIILVINFILVIVIYYGFGELNKIGPLAYIVRHKLRNNELENINLMNTKAMEEVKRTTKHALWLFSIMAFCWIFETICILLNIESDMKMIVNILFGFQGITILVLFVFSKYFRKIILEEYHKNNLINSQCWSDRGSIDLRKREAETAANNELLNKNITV